MSTKGRYAVRAMVELAAETGSRPATSGKIARLQGLSQKYVEQLLTALKRAKLVRSVLGPRGGYVLTRDPSKINVLDVVEATEGAITFSECVDDPDECGRSRRCPVRSLWRRAGKAAGDVLRGTSLRQLAEQSVSGRRSARGRRG